MDTRPTENQSQTSVTGFLLMGFSIDPNNQNLLFVIGLFIYLLTLGGNLAIITLIMIDQHLQTPMYFLLGNLSFVEICCTSTTAPKMLWDLLAGNKTISYIGCALQLYFFGTFGSTECILLSAMAYDRYVAVCHPLHYTLLLNQTVCRCLLAASGLLAISIPLLIQPWSFPYISVIPIKSIIFSVTFLPYYTYLVLISLSARW